MSLRSNLSSYSVVKYVQHRGLTTRSTALSPDEVKESIERLSHGSPFVWENVRERLSVWGCYSFGMHDSRMKTQIYIYIYIHIQFYVIFVLRRFITGDGTKCHPENLPICWFQPGMVVHVSLGLACRKNGPPSRVVQCLQQGGSYSHNSWLRRSLGQGTWQKHYVVCRTNIVWWVLITSYENHSSHSKSSRISRWLKTWSDTQKNWCQRNPKFIHIDGCECRPKKQGRKESKKRTWLGLEKGNSKMRLQEN